ncbi:PRC-barrel domain-containing protein [Shouchella sp. 1P09AA]|uniref:PRC-barrel domain-containing protein n=1 Tax=unclassified Shouchella TaxID=2893065 RepID=UPI0039A29227
MLIHAKSLSKFNMNATDGELGQLDDFYIDSHTLNVRYFVGDTRTWFFGGKVLLNVDAFTDIDLDEGHISINATKEQIKNSPKPDDAAPINRFYEQELSEHYGWPAYWSVPAVPTASGYGTTTAAGAPLIPPVYTPNPTETAEDTKATMRTGAEEQKMEEKFQQHVHLFSLDELKGYHVHAKGGEVGKVLDFVLHFDKNVEIGNWSVRYMIVDVGGFMQKEPIIVPMQTVKEVTWFDNSIIIDLDKEKIEEAEEYTTEQTITAETEQGLFTHYQLTPYWERKKEEG